MAGAVWRGEGCEGRVAVLGSCAMLSDAHIGSHRNSALLEWLLEWLHEVSQPSPLPLQPPALAGPKT